MSQKRGGFTLPKTLAEKVEKKDEQVAKREVYVAITRAKQFCTISYAQHDIKGADLELAHIIAELPDVHFMKKTVEQTTGELIAHGESVYTKHEPVEITGTDVEQLQELVRARYAENNISVTLLNNFFECPWKWYFRNFLQLPDVKGASLMFGSAMHGILETILRDSKAPTKKQLENLVRDALMKEGIEEAHLEQETSKGIVCIENFLENDFKNLATNRITERSVSYRDPQFPNLSMYGKIDLTETFPDGTVAVTDFKTGGSKTTGMIEKIDDDGRMSDYLRQLAMYSYLIMGNNNSAQVAQSKLYFLEASEKDKNRVYATRITDEHVELLKRDIADYQNAIESGTWISQVCHFKSYGSGATECEYCKRAREVYVK
jgi:ATP-dependent helicase/DNAse subunit B